MTLKEFLKETDRPNTLSPSIPWWRPMIVCNDGFIFSVQDHPHSYSRKDSEGNILSMEISISYFKESLLKKYREAGESGQDICPYVPIEVIEEVVTKHKDITPRYLSYSNPLDFDVLNDLENNSLVLSGSIKYSPEGRNTIIEFLSPTLSKDYLISLPDKDLARELFKYKNLI